AVAVRAPPYAHLLGTAARRLGGALGPLRIAAATLALPLGERLAEGRLVGVRRRVLGGALVATAILARVLVGEIGLLGIPLEPIVVGTTPALALAGPRHHQPGEPGADQHDRQRIVAHARP